MHTAVRARRRTIGILIAGAAALVAATVVALPAQAADPIAQVGSPVRDTNTAQLDYGDVAPVIINDGGTIYVVNSDGHLALSPDEEQLTWHRFSGPDMDHLTPLADADNTAFVKQAPGNNDMYWITGGWKDPNATTDTWYATVHVEYNYAYDGTGAVHNRRVMLAKSTDQGAHWTNLGNILTLDPSAGWPSGETDFGPGDQRLVVDIAGGYFYLFYWSGYTDAYGWWNHQSVARCPISSKMAPGCWQKWYGSSFSQPGLGGHDGTIMSFTASHEDPTTHAMTSDSYSYDDVPAFSFNTSLNEWIAIGHDWMASATSLATQNWTGREYFPTTANCNYPFTWDPSTKDPSITSNTFRLYQFGFTVNCGPNATRYYPVTLSPSSILNPTSWQASTGSFFTAFEPWRYEYTTNGGSTFSPLGYSSTYGEWISPTDRYCTVFAPTQQHPGTPGASGCASSRTWVSPGAQANAPITVNGPITVTAGCGGNTSGVDLRILKNTTQIWPASGSVNVPNGMSYTSFPTNLTTNLATGDRIRFLVTAHGTSNGCDSTTWDPQIGTPSLDVVTPTWQAARGYSQGVYAWQEDYTTDGTTFQPMTITTMGGIPVYQGTSDAYCDVFSSSQQHPGSAGCSSARTWVAPYAATVTLGAFGPITVAASCSGNTSGVTVRIMKNSTQIWAGSAAIANGGSLTFPSGVTTPVVAGDQLHFVVTAVGTSNACDGTTWDQTVTVS